MKTCKQCKKKFDFDEGGFESSFGGYVCSKECAYKHASKKDRHIAIHNESGAIVETDIPARKRGEK